MQDKNAEIKKTCTANVPGEPKERRNQHTLGYTGPYANYLQVYFSLPRSNPREKKFDVEEAFVYYAEEKHGKVNLENNYDIGIIITKRITEAFTRNLKPLELPKNEYFLTFIPSKIRFSMLH